MQNYQQFIIKELELRAPGAHVDPRHVEGYIRLAFSDPSTLSEDDLREEVMIALICISDEIKEYGPKKAKERSEYLAKSFQL